ncbi:hypothetical protein [Crenobacter intestini]|uniref:Restriction endonuclease n=1 Tax=Crenobacter intestini TaxID=2563443 RepID=A0A4T0V111_9NEIS|nr:hypothetical protein [Crenobacter intestini]TIC85194.1 hypothetical protein E5K04_04120 [Crenobacter intestini]
MKTLRKELAKALHNAATKADQRIGKSLNDVPEYYMNVLIAEHVYDAFETYTFSLEDQLSDLAKDIGFALDDLDEAYRGNGRVDLVFRSKRSKKVKHIVEMKRTLAAPALRSDALRLAMLCAKAPNGHRMEKNFLVAIGHHSADTAAQRAQEMQDWLAKSDAELGKCIEVRFEPVDFGELVSTRGRGVDNPLVGGVWEFKYAAK